MSKISTILCGVIVMACVYGYVMAESTALDAWTDGFIQSDAEWNPYAYDNGGVYTQRTIAEPGRCVFEFNIFSFRDKIIRHAELRCTMSPSWGGYDNSVEIYQMPSNLSANRHDWDVEANGTLLLTWNNNSTIALDVTAAVQGALQQATQYDRGICFVFRSLYPTGTAGFIFGGSYDTEPKLYIEYVDAAIVSETSDPWTDGFIQSNGEWNPYAYDNGGVYTQRYIAEPGRGAFEFNIHDYKNEVVTYAELQCALTPLWGGYMDSVEIYQMPSNLSANRHDWDVEANGSLLLTWNNNNNVVLDVTREVINALPGATSYDQGICFVLRSLYPSGTAGFIFGGTYAKEPKLYVEYTVDPGPQSCAEVIAAGSGYVADLNEDCYVEWADFGIFASQWQLCNDPTDPQCSPAQ